MNTLYVLFENRLVGTLRRDAELAYSFVYEDSWRQAPDSFPLSVAMPLTEKEFGNKITLSFFENLLPEGDVRKSLEQSHRFSGAMDFLAEFGRDCAGAIILATSEDYRQAPNNNKVLVDMNKVYQAIDEHGSVADMISEMRPGYLSLAGAQDKFPAIFDKDQFYLPTHGAPTTHIVKIPIWRHGVKESVFNELYCMRLARSIGFNVPECFVVSGRHPLFVVERFDRSVDKNGVVHRLHQQDLCQAHGITSESKYEDKGGPSIKDNYNLLVTHISVKKRLESLHRFMDWICFNLLIGNNDSHSKNLSLLFQAGKNELAPFYDLVSTAIYPKLIRSFAFKIGDRDDFSRIGKNQFHLLEEQLGLKRGTMLERLKLVNEMALTKKDEVAFDILASYPEAKIIPRISALIEERSKSLQMQKALSH